MNNQEKKILLLIKLVPTVIAVLFFLTIFYIVFRNIIIQGEHDIDNIKQSYIKKQKNLVRNRVKFLIRNIEYKRKLAESDLKENLKNRVDEAYAIVSSIYVQNRHKSKEEVLELIKDALRPMRFNHGRGYYFIYGMDLKNILLPIRIDLEETDFSNYKDIKGDFVVKNVAKLVKQNGSTFYTWYWRKPYNQLKNYKKIGYNRYFKSLDMFIGTGEYLEDFEKDLRKKIIKEIRDLRYTTNGYFFIINYDGQILADAQKSLIEKNNINLQNKNGVFLVKEIINIAKNGGGFFGNTIKFRPPSGKVERKILYTQGIDSWKWAVGTSVYMDDIEKSIKNKKDILKEKSNSSLYKMAIIFIVAVVILVFILTLLSKKIEEIFVDYKNNMIEEAKKSKQQLLLVEHQNKLASLGEMLGNISHQWKQPLNAIGLSLSKLKLLNENDKLSKELLDTSLERMEKNIIHLSDTIDVFRNFFKPNAQENVFSVKELINNTIFIIKDTFSDKKIDLSCICEESITLKGDMQKLEQALLNILNNAKDALSSSAASNAKVSIDVKLNDDNVLICIEDNGPGIPKETQEKIFIPYFTTKFKSQGTGIGLYMSKMIVENNFNGTLSFENKSTGARFIISIPK